MNLLRLLAALSLSRAAFAAAVPATPAVPASSTTAATPAVPATPASLSISISTPAAGARLAGSVALSASAKPGDVAGIQFSLDGADLGPRVASKPFTTIWNTAGTPDGPHLLTATVYDRNGRTMTSDAVPVVVGNQPPIAAPPAGGDAGGGVTPSTPAAPAPPAPSPLTVSLSAPAAGAHLTGTVALTANAASGDAAAVQFQLDGGDLGPRVSSRPFAALWNTAGTPDGPHLLAVVVFDGAGRSSASDAVPVVVENQPLLISGLSVSGVSGTGASIAWTTSKPSEGQIEYGPTPAYGASTVLESGESVSHSAVLTGLTPGTTYHFRADAQSGSKPRVESEDAMFLTPAVSSGGAPPAVSIMNPAPGAFVAGTINVSVNAVGPSSVASVQLMADGTELGAPATAPPFVFPWNTASVADGQHALSAIAADAAGNSATAVVNVVVANTPPVLSPPAVSGLGGDRADILWTTDQRSDSAVDYGTAPAYGAATPVNATQSTGHGVPLRGLLPGTQYHYRARSRNAAGVQATSDDLTFTTSGSTASVAPGVPVPTTNPPDQSTAKAPQKFLTPATADGINDKAVFGPAAREVTIFDIRGHKVFHAASAGAGAPIVWDCKDGSGRVVVAGVYLAKIKTGDSSTVYQSFAVAK